MANKQKQITVVTGCVIDRGQILITQRFEPELPEADRKWDLPGGTAEFGESTAEVARREIREETGLEVEPLELIPHVHTNLWRYADKYLHVIVLCYVCRLAGGRRRVRRQAGEVRRAVWTDLGDIDLTTLLPGVREFLAWVAKKKFGVVGGLKSCRRRVYMECVDPDHNVDKFYFLTDEPPTFGNQSDQLGLFDEVEFGERSTGELAPFLVNRSWGRRGATPKFALEEYYSEVALLRSFSKVLSRRQARGYSIVESTIGLTFAEALMVLESDIRRLVE